MRDKGSGINAFECSQDNWDKNVFHFWERYESNSHLGRHNTAPEFKTFMEKVRGTMAGACDRSGQATCLPAHPPTDQPPSCLGVESSGP